jgi:membrane protease subunit (stomatin/prohibitin family)
MFKKSKSVHFEGKQSDLIFLHPEKDFAKKTEVEIPQGYHLILMSSGGQIELVKGVYQYELTERTMYLYYVRDHIGVQKSTWGTRTRLNVKSESGEAFSLGGYGFIEWQLINAMRFIERRWGNRYFVQVEDMTKEILDYIPQALGEVVGKIQSFDVSNPDFYKRSLKDGIFEKMKELLKDFGIELHQFAIENFNFQRSEEA